MDGGYSDIHTQTTIINTLIMYTDHEEVRDIHCESTLNESRVFCTEQIHSFETKNYDRFKKTVL